jgi:hypothetical protein
MHTKEDYCIVAIVIFNWIFFAATVSYFIGAGVFDPLFFTYITYFANYCFYGFLYASLYSYPMLELAVLGFFPIVYGMTTFVFFPAAGGGYKLNLSFLQKKIFRGGVNFQPLKPGYQIF